MNLEPVDSRERLEELRGGWSELWERSPSATPFQSPEWLLPWWEAFHPGRLCSLALFDSGSRLAGLAPLYRGEDGVARFMGSGISDYLDVLAEPEHAASFADAVFERAGDADLMELPEASPLVGRAAEAVPCSACPVAPLPARPGKGLRRNIRRYGDSLAAEGEVGYETSLDGNWREHLAALFGLHEARWKAAGEPGGVLGDPRLAGFHQQAAAGFAARGWLRMFGLRFRGEPAAVLYTFAARRRAYFYLSGFEPGLARFGPGVLLLDFALKRYAGEGFGEADFLRGREAYKYDWGAADQMTRRVRTGGAR